MPPDIQFMLGEMNAKLDTLARGRDEDRKTVEKLREQIERLEAFKWRLLGAAAAIGGFGGFITEVFTP